MGGQPIERKGAIGSLGTAIRWLRSRPELLVAFGLAAAVEEAPNLLWDSETKFLMTVGEPTFGIGPAGTGPGGLVFVVVIGLLGLLAPTFATAVGHVYAGDLVLEKRPSFGDAVSTAAIRLPVLVAVSILYSIAVAVGLVFLIFPGIYIGLRLILAFPAVVIDGQGVTESLGTSWDIAHGNLLKIVGIYFAAGIVAGLIVLAAVVVLFVLVSGFVEPFDVAAVRSGSSSTGTLVVGFATIGYTTLMRALSELALGRVYIENTERTVATSTRASSLDAGVGSATD